MPIRPVIVLDANPKEIEKNDTVRISARLFNKDTLSLMEVSRIFMTITSLKDGHTLWPLEVIRKNASGFDIAIGTQEMKQGHDYLVRVSNNYNLSPSSSTTFTIKEGISPLVPFIPLALSPIFLKKYSDKGIKDVDGLVDYLKSQGFNGEQIQRELKKIMKSIDEGDVKIPVDTDREIISKKFVTQQDHRVCQKCFIQTLRGENNDGVWEWDDPNAPEIPIHPQCRCVFSLTYATERTDEFRSAALMAGLYDIETPLQAIQVIQNNTFNFHNNS